MDQALVGAIVSALVEVVAKKLLSASIAEVKLVLGFKKDLKKLTETLLKVQNLIPDAERKQFNNGFVKGWLEKLEGVAFQAHAMLEDLNYELLRQKVDHKTQASKKVMSFISPASNILLFQQKMAHKIRDINKRLDQLDAEAKTFGFQVPPMVIASVSDTDTVGVVMPLRPGADSFSALKQNFVGREADLSNVIEMIVNVPLAETVSVIPIVGMAGVGKTSLVRKVFFDEKITTHFRNKIWVCGASAHFDAPTLFEMILQLSTGENVQGLNITHDEVLEMVSKHFTSEKYLLVLDSICIDELAKWEDFIHLLSRISYSKGNCVVVTTRKANVASIIETLSTHQLGCLSEDDVCSVIRSTVDVHVRFRNIGKSIVERCHGLPLTAKVIGGLLNGKSRNDWAILDSQLANSSQDEIADMEMLIKFSYDCLPFESLKKCFKFCSIFPQDYIIEKEQLIELWMAEGFLQADQTSDMETTGNIFFNHLLQMSLLEEVERDCYGNVTRCQMHDVVHGLACSISSSGSSRMMDGRSGINQLQYLAIESVLYDEPLSYSEQQTKYLSTLFLKGKVACNMLSRFKYLHSLTVTGADIQELPNMIGKLKRLKLLDFSKTKITHLPGAVCKLYNLQTLRTTNLQKLPDCFTNLISLRHLHIPCIQLPPRVGRLSFLHTLRFYEVGHEEGCRIGELGNLKKLEGKLEIRNLERIRDDEEAKSADLYGKPKIFKLVLAWNELGEGDNNNEVVLEGLQPHPNLKSLKIIGYKGRKIPLWMMMMETHGIEGRREAFNSLVKIKLSNCCWCEEIPMLGHLPRLKDMELSHLPNVLSLGPSFYGVERSTSEMGSNLNLHGTFPALERLILSEMQNLQEWFHVEGATSTFPTLLYLEIKSCPQLKTTPNNFPCLKRLVVNNVDADFSLTDVCSKTSSLQELRISSIPRLVSLPDRLFVRNQSLSILSIHNCPNLIHLVPGCVGGGECLKSLRIANCENLRELFDDAGTLQSLELLEIMKCPALESIPHVKGHSLKSLQCLKIHECQRLSIFPFELLEACTSSLEILGLYDLENLENFSTFFPLLSRMVHLKQLRICKLPKLNNLPTEISCFRSLRAFSSGGFSESLDLASFNDFLHCILEQSSDSLEYLHVVGEVHWNSLPDHIQHLTALRFLKLSDFGIEALPEWYGRLSCIQELYTENCQALRR